MGKPVKLAVTGANGVVVLDLGGRTNCLGLTPDEARALAAALVRQADAEASRAEARKGTT